MLRPPLQCIWKPLQGFVLLCTYISSWLNWKTPSHILVGIGWGINIIIIAWLCTQWLFNTPLSILSKSEKVCGTAFSVKKKLRNKYINPGVIFGPFGVILGHYGSFLSHFGSLWVIFGPFCGIFGHICGKFKFLCGIVGVARLAFRMYVRSIYQ